MQLFEESIRQGMASMTPHGTLVVETGEFTGRAAKNKYLVRNPVTEHEIDWGKVNQPIDEQTFLSLWDHLKHRISESPFRRIFQGHIGPFPLRIDSVSPWHIAFAQNMFRKNPAEFLAGNGISGLQRSERGFQILHDPYCKIPDLDRELGTKIPGTAIVLDPGRRRVAIVGTAYAGEIKKAAFSLCNYLLPELGWLPMHASANCDENGGATCVLFGLSGTGKTTLSSASDRLLVGDDEVLWSRTGISNLEGGCYAKLIDLDAEQEPRIFKAVTSPGAILENVAYDPRTGTVDFKDRSRTENTRGSYALEALEGVYRQDREASHPKTVVFLTADAFGALPAVARLDPWQAQYHFISGYTAKVAGTELGIQAPEATFSPCFGAPFMPRHVSAYATLLADFARKSGASIWMLNTGWLGDGYGKSPRMPIAASRRLLSAIQSGELERCFLRRHPIFGFQVPESCPGVDPKLLAWPSETASRELAERFTRHVAALLTRSPGKIAPEVITRGGPKN